MSGGASPFLTADATSARTGGLLATIAEALRINQARYGSGGTQPAVPENDGDTDGIVVAMPNPLPDGPAPAASDNSPSTIAGDDVLESAAALASTVLQGTPGTASSWDATPYAIGGIIGAASGVISGVAVWMIRSWLASAPAVVRVRAHPQRLTRRRSRRPPTHGSRWQRKTPAPSDTDAVADVHEPTAHQGGPTYLN
jgi:hypothetical protein